MADQLKARPVSGEIMTGPRARPDGDGAARLDAVASGDIVDADYMTLPRSPSDADQAQSYRAPPSEPPSSHGMGMLRRADPEPVRRFSKQGGPAFWAAGIGLASAAFWVSGGHALISHMSLATESGSMLSISAVTSRVDQSGERPVLFVDGEAGNDGASAAPLPPLEISVTGNDGSITRYRLGTSQRALAPGERFGFSSRVEVPRNGVKTVSVAFAG
jgi:hypothetical protein